MRVVRRHKLHAVFGHAHLFQLGAQAQAVKELHIGRQQRFTDMKARMVGLFQHHHILALLGQQGAHGGAGRAAANHKHITGLRRGSGCVHSGLVAVYSEKMPSSVWRCTA